MSSGYGSESSGEGRSYGYNQEEQGPTGRGEYGGQRYGQSYGSQGNYGREGGYGQEFRGGSQGSGQGQGYGQRYGSSGREEQSGFRNRGYEQERGRYASGSRSYDGYERESEGQGWSRGYDSSSSSSGAFGRGQTGGYGSRGMGSLEGSYGSTYGSSSPSEFGRPRGRFAGKGPKGYQRSDDRVKEDVSDLLERNDELDASEIEVNVQSGEVTLEGTVNDRRSKRLAEDLIEDLPGVKQVHNRLRVDQSGSESGKESGSTKSGKSSYSSRSTSSSSTT
ncbi:MAG TPA: BON domain-containing protein [Thermoanaerobaculia bacterium]